MDLVSLIFAGLAAVGGTTGFVSFLLWRSQNKKLLAETKNLDIQGDVLMSDKALEMYEAMSVRTEKAEAKADAAEKRASQCIAGTYELIEHIYVLRRLMADHNIEPPPFRFPSSITGISTGVQG